MKKNVTWLSAIAAVAVVTLGLAAAAPASAQELKCEPDKVAQKYPKVAGKSIKIGADPQTPPYVFLDAKDNTKVIGFDADLARAVFDCAGIKHEFFLGGWSGLLPAVVAGQIDVMWDDLYYTAERAKQVEYVIYMQALTGALSRAGNPKKVGGIPDVCGGRAAVGLGTVEEAAMRDQDGKCKAAGKGGVEILTYPDVAAGFRLVENDRTDIMLTDLVLVDEQVTKNPKTFARAFKIVTGFKVGAAVANDNTDLLRAIHDGMRIAQANGTQKKLFEQYKMDPDLQLPADILKE